MGKLKVDWSIEQRIKYSCSNATAPHCSYSYTTNVLHFPPISYAIETPCCRVIVSSLTLACEFTGRYANIDNCCGTVCAFSDLEISPAHWPHIFSASSKLVH